MKFSEELKLFKKNNQLTQDKMASVLGISLRMYQYYERGDYDGSDSNIDYYRERLKKHLGKDASVAHSNNAEITILYQDQSRDILKNKHGYNCTGEAVIQYWSTFKNAYVKNLIKKPIKAIRIATSEGSVDAYVSETNAIKIMEKLKCLYKLI